MMNSKDAAKLEKTAFRHLSDHGIHRIVAPAVHLLALGLFVFQAQAATINVGTNLDISGNCSLRDALESARTDTSVGDCEAGDGADEIDLSAISNQTIVLNGSPLVSANGSDFTILGNNVTIDGNKASQVLRIGKVSTVVLQNLQMINGNNELGNGGCLSVNDNVVTLEIVSISGCSATNGGGLYASNSIVNLLSTHIADNKTYSGGSGGGTFQKGGTFTISASTLSGNTGDFLGGGAHFESGTASVSNSSFIGNDALEGGGLYSQSKLLLSNTTIQSNGAQFGAGLSQGGGTIDALDSNISGNVAIVDGGGVWIRGGAITLTSSNLVSNTAQQGGAIRQVSTGKVHIRDSTIEMNNSSGSGGGIFFDSGQHSITNGTFRDNRSGGNGGGMFTAGSIDLKDSTLSDNHADLSGGGIYFDLQLSQLIGNSLFQGNTAGIQGGAFYQDEGDISVNHTTFKGNSAPGSGGAIFIFSGQLRVNGSTMADNHSGGNGGAVFSRTTFFLDSSTLSGNGADGDGGGLYAWKPSTHTISNSTLSGNYAGSGAGALAVDEATVIVYDSTITDSASSQVNGAPSVWITDNGSLTLYNSILYNPADAADCGVGTSASFPPWGYNLVAVIGDCVPGGGILEPGNPMLGAQADNGGSTLTHLPQPGSAVIDAGDNADVPAGLTRDQRGPHYLRIDGSAVELGAVEVTTALPQVIFNDGFEP